MCPLFGKASADPPHAPHTHTSSTPMSEIEKEIAASHSGDEDEELEQMKARVREMEAEAEKLRSMTAQAGPTSGGSTGSGGEMAADFGEESAEVVDSRSVYVGNVSVTRIRRFEDKGRDADGLFWCRWTMGRLLKSCKHIFRRWGP